MGTPKAAADQALIRGIAAYQKTIGLKEAPPVPEKTPAFRREPAGQQMPDKNVLKAKSAIEAFQKKEKQKPVSTNDNEARKFLQETLGKERGSAFYDEVPKGERNIFGFLEDFTPSQLNIFFRSESPAAEALVLSQLSPKLSSQVLANAPPERKAELALRLARKKEISHIVLEQVAAALREKAWSFSLSPDADEDSAKDGVDTLTAILKSAEVSFGEKLLEDLERTSPALGRSLKEKLFTLEDAVIIPARVLEEKLREMKDRDIILLLKYPLESFKQKIISGLSEGREQRLREESEFLGSVAKIEVDAAARDFLAWFRAAGPWVTEEK